MYYTIYKVTNQIDGKFYIGSHKTKNLNDTYMGSGKYLKRAIEKYGIENFTKEILFVFDNAEDMYKKESEIVNVDFLVTENTYNLKIGGFGGWDYLNSWENNPTHAVEHMTKMSHARLKKMNSDDNYLEEIKRKISSKVRHKYDNDKNYKEKITNHLSQIWPGRKHSDESRKKMSLSAQGKQDGEKNSQFGTMWITNEIEDKKVKKTDSIPSGWRKGRKKIGVVP